VDYGKAAATFIDSETEQAVRIAPHPCSRERAASYAGDATSRWHGYLQAYQVMPDDELFTIQRVTPMFSVSELISTPKHRVSCERCGEEIINEREVVLAGQVLCRACAGQAYYSPTRAAITVPLPTLVLGHIHAD
jgi:formylmethanofuran dehydrogenase subunit E